MLSKINILVTCLAHVVMKLKKGEKLRKYTDGTKIYVDRFQEYEQ
jgi:hypothetical protein